MTLRIGILGRGRLGGLVAAAVRAAPDLELAWTTGRGDEPGTGADVAVDVSAAAAVPGHLAWASATGTDLVVGTTGWDPAQLHGVDMTRVGVLVAPNFSLSVALVRRLAVVLGRYAARSEEPVDLAVLDRHHRAKVDAPSGTALLLAGALAEGSGRPMTDLEMTSQRLGAVIGLHEVRWETPSETILLSHEVHSRQVFAQGALAAARWVHRRPGRHTLDDLAGDLLDPLLTDPARKPSAPLAPAPA